MKIAIVRRECGLGFGGAEAYCENVAKGLRDIGHNTVIVARSSRVASVPWVEAKIFGRGSIAKNLSFFFSVKKVLATGGFDCTYGLSRVPNVDFLRISDPLHALWLRLGYQDRFLPAFIRCRLPRHLALLWQEREAIKSAKYIITNSKLVKGQIEDVYGISPQSVFTVYNGVDLKRFSPATSDEKVRLRRGLGLSDKETVILFAGVDFRRKGLELLLRSAASLKNFQPLRILLLGFKPPSKIKNLVSRLGLSHKVSYLGYRRDTENFYKASDLFCLPTNYDPFANACLEAMACGIPVITTAQNGAAELVERVSQELVVPSNNIEKLKNALCFFLEADERSRQVMGAASRDIAAGLSWSSHISQLDRLFQKMI